MIVFIGGDSSSTGVLMVILGVLYTSVAVTTTVQAQLNPCFFKVCKNTDSLVE